MYVKSDTGQNANKGGTRVIKYNFDNNTHKDVSTQKRNYVYKVMITNKDEQDAKTGISGHRFTYKCDAIFQDETIRHIDTLADWHSTKTNGTDEKVDYIGTEWNKYRLYR